MKMTQRRTLLLFITFAMLASAAFGQVAKRTSTPRDKEAAASFRALLDLRDRLDKMPDGGEKREPYKSLLKANEKRVFADEPSGRYLVRSEEFWQLRDKYKDLAIADDIAWAAAENPLGGECEGFMNCGIYADQITLGRYLGYYPRGKHSKAAATRLKDAFAPYADESLAGVSFTPPEDAADRAELKKMLRELDAVLVKVQGAAAAEARRFIKTIGDRYK